MITALGNIKDGVGKTTLAVNLAIHARKNLGKNRRSDRRRRSKYGDPVHRNQGSSTSTDLVPRTKYG